MCVRTARQQFLASEKREARGRAGGEEQWRRREESLHRRRKMIERWSEGKTNKGS